MLFQVLRLRLRVHSKFTSIILNWVCQLPFFQCHEKGNLQKEAFIWVYDSREISVHHSGATRQQIDTATGTGSQEITSSTMNMKQREKREMGRRCILPKSTTSDILLPTKSHLFKHPQTVPTTGYLVFQHMSLQVTLFIPTTSLGDRVDFQIPMCLFIK